MKKYYEKKIGNSMARVGSELLVKLKNNPKTLSVTEKRVLHQRGFIEITADGLRPSEKAKMFFEELGI